MKNVLLILLLAASAITTSAQLKTTPICPPFSVDLLEGNVNGVEPDFSQVEIKKVFPCTSSEDAETATCGGKLNYADKGIYFFITKAYIEIRENFKGKLSLPLMGAVRNSLFKWLGYPKIKDINWDAFTTKYGILILHYNKASKVNLIQFSKKNSDSISLCE
jgi:hypothetical protein